MHFRVKFWTGREELVEASSLREAMKIMAYTEEELEQGYHEEDGKGTFTSVEGDWCATVTQLVEQDEIKGIRLSEFRVHTIVTTNDSWVCSCGEEDKL